jgi:hypothetical protein
MSPPIDLDTLVLDKGSHRSPADGMCVMEAVSFLAGEDFTDAPECTSPVIRAFLVSWNDVLSDDDRQALKRYVPLVIGTRGTPADEVRRAWMATDWLVRVQAPAWLRLAGLGEQADVLAALAELTPGTCPSILPALEAVRSDAAAAWAAAGAAAWAAAWDAARAAAWAAAGDAAWAAAWDAARAAAGDAAGDAARAAAGDAAGDAARAAAWDAARDAAGAAAGDAARAAAWDAARAAARDAARDAARAAARDAARAAARDAAGAAARDALAPTVSELTASAHDLLDRMISVTAGVSA